MRVRAGASLCRAATPARYRAPVPAVAPDHVDVVQPPFAEDALRAVRHLLDLVPSFGEDQRLALASFDKDQRLAGADPDPTRLVGFLAPSGYAQLLRRPGGSWLELAVLPGPGQPTAARALLGASVGYVRAHGGAPVHLWQHDPTPEEQATAVAAGFVPDRTLLQMRCALPVPAARRGRAAPLPLRPFRPGADEDAWLTTNNRAFADHPEQGAWTRQELEAREREPWFDPDGFLVLEVDGTVVASCWTKLHQGVEPEGEIYVISVDPDHHGRGLGRALTLAGLDWIAGRGYRRGMLYVDAANASAVGLYRSLGFTVSRIDEALVAEP